MSSKVETVKVPLEKLTATLPPRASVALVGNPNSGKSTLFNRLTGMKQKTANFPGVTVEKRSGKLSIDEIPIELIDLPGTYSLTPYSTDEKITVSVLLDRLENETTIDAAIAVVDATRLYQSLCLVQQLIELNKPVMLVLTMIDVAKQDGIQVNIEKLRNILQGIQIVSVVATSGAGLPEFKSELVKLITREYGDKDSFWPELREKAIEIQAQLSQEKAATPVHEIERALIDSTVEFDDPTLMGHVSSTRQSLCQDQAPVAVEARQRFLLSKQIVEQVQTSAPPVSQWVARLTTKINQPIPATLLFFLLMAVIFQAVFAWATPLMDMIDNATAGTGQWIEGLLPTGMLSSLIVDGVIAGVGSVIIFLPQIIILFLFIIILEDTGYLARAAFLSDKAMRSLGLSGQSVIPLLSSFACAVPGIMATRVIPDRRDRLATIIAAPFMTCSARLPVYALLIAAFVPNTNIGFLNLQGLVLFGLYLLGIAGGVFTAFLLKRSALKGPKPSFMLALPEFRVPNLQTVLLKLLDRARIFLKRAGTIIFFVAVIVWALSYFPRSESIQSEKQAAYQQAQATLNDEALETRLTDIDNKAAADQLSQSWLGRSGQFVAPVFEPLGWDWRISAAVIASFPAREVVIAVLGTIYAVGAEADEATLSERIQSASWEDGTKIFSLPVVIGLLVFYAWCLQCGATIAIMRRETGGWRWPLFAWTYMTLLGYSAALLVNFLF